MLTAAVVPASLCSLNTNRCLLVWYVTQSVEKSSHLLTCILATRHWLA